MPGQKYKYETDEIQDTGIRVPYSVKVRKGMLRVTFPHPETGERLEKATGLPEHKLIELKPAALRVILPYYAKKNGPASRSKLCWDKLDTILVEKHRAKPRTLESYRKAIRAFRVQLPDISPANIERATVRDFKTAYATTPGRFGKPRSSETVNNTLLHLRCVWNELVEREEVTTNPFSIKRGQGKRKRRVRFPRPELVAEFKRWCELHYPECHALHLFVDLKEATGCRHEELCVLRTRDFDGERLHFRASTTKAGKDRYCPVTDELAVRLSECRGTFLFESAYQTMPTRGEAGFSPAWFYERTQKVFQKFNKGRLPEDKLHGHDFRARAVTIITKIVGIDRACQIMGVTHATARHYLDASVAFDAVADMRGLLDELATKRDAKRDTAKEGREAGLPKSL